MKTYLGTKQVRMKPMTRGEYNALRGWVVPEDENPSDEGYLVEYLDGGKPNHSDFAGYISWSPKEQADKAYRPVDGMTFGLALEALKRNERVTRAGWNGKGMWLGIHKDDRLCNHEGTGLELEYADYIAMKTADDKIVPWVASQTDMLAEDWSIV